MDALGVGSGRGEHAYRRGSSKLGSLVPLLVLWLAACSGGGEDGNDGLVLTSPSDSASISLSAYPSNVQSGGFATLSWKANNLNSCTGTGGWSGTKSTEGTTTVGPLTGTTVFTLECEDTATFSASSCKTAQDCKGRGAEKRKKKSATVTVDDQPPPPPPTVSLDAAPTSVTAGDVSTLTWWSTDADACEALQDWSGTKPISGNEDVGPLLLSSEFALTCSNTGGATTQSAVVNVDAAPPPPVPTVSLTANPTSVAYNGSATVTWSSTNANFCLADDAWSGERLISGSETIGDLTISSTFALTCMGDGGSASQSVTVTVQSQTGTADLSWTPPTTNEDGSPVTLTSFNVYAGTSPTSLLKIATVPATQTTFTANGLQPGTTYFAVTAVSDTAESTFSNVESKTF
jgi:hypothetical protein